MPKPWLLEPSIVGGKYLVVRRDGTIPSWDHFVLSETDPATIPALSAYALAVIRQAGVASPDRAAELLTYAEGVKELLDLWAGRQGDDVSKPARLRRADEKAPDPEKGPHRVDNPAIVAMMQHRYDLTGYGGPHMNADGKPFREIAREFAGVAMGNATEVGRLEMAIKAALAVAARLQDFPDPGLKARAALDILADVVNILHEAVPPKRGPHSTFTDESHAMDSGRPMPVYVGVDLAPASSPPKPDSK